MNDTTTMVEDIRRIEPGPEAAELAMEMYDRLLAELGELSPSDWEAPTVCAPWTVADVVRHMVGAARGHASLRESARQIWVARRTRGDHDGNDMDAMNALQVADHAGFDPSGLLDRLRELAPAAVAKRMSVPRPLRRIRIPNSPGGSTATGMPPSLTLGHLWTVILTRDVFVHRLDIARATGREIAVDQMEGRLIADVVAEWADRHGRPFRLSLTGPAGGRYVRGDDGPALELDALDFCWILSGRGEATHPLLETRVLF